MKTVVVVAGLAVVAFLIGSSAGTVTFVLLLAVSALTGPPATFVVLLLSWFVWGITTTAIVVGGRRGLHRTLLRRGR